MTRAGKGCITRGGRDSGAPGDGRLEGEDWRCIRKNAIGHRGQDDRGGGERGKSRR